MKTFIQFLFALLWAIALSPLSIHAQAPETAASFQSKVYFDFGRSQLKPDAQSVLDQIDALINRTPGARIRITAHADSIGSEARNLAVSRQRAEAVRHALIARHISADRIELVFLGEAQPEADNSTEAGRQANRRALLEVFAEQPAAVTAAPVLSNPVIQKAPEPKQSAKGIAPAAPVLPIDLPMQVRDEATELPVPNALVHYDIDGHRDSAYTGPDGRLTVRALPKTRFKLEVFAKNYYYSSQELSMPDATPANAQVIKLKISDEGSKAALPNLNFYAMDTVLVEASQPELENVLRFMQINNKLKVEISGHVSIKKTDTMTDQLWELSTNRAKVVYDYLLRNGIPASRMTYKGYGNEQLLFPDINDLDEDLQNRRVEIKVLEKK